MADVRSRINFLLGDVRFRLVLGLISLRSRLRLKSPDVMEASETQIDVKNLGWNVSSETLSATFSKISSTNSAKERRQTIRP